MIAGKLCLAETYVEIHMRKHGEDILHFGFGVLYSEQNVDVSSEVLYLFRRQHPDVFPLTSLDRAYPIRVSVAKKIRKYIAILIKVRSRNITKEPSDLPRTIINQQPLSLFAVFIKIAHIVYDINHTHLIL
jgi:hypothetical protein